MILNDSQIRPQLINFLSKKIKKTNSKIIEELTVNNGFARADVVALDDKMHCFEIKGETDCVERILHQGKFYNNSFNTITLVTTENHLNKAFEISPDFWGIIVASNKNEVVQFKEIRKPLKNPDFIKEDALSVLWKSELEILAKNNNIICKKSFSKEKYIKAIAENLTDMVISKSISNIVKNRVKFENFVPCKLCVR